MALVQVAIACFATCMTHNVERETARDDVLPLCSEDREYDLFMPDTYE